MEEWDVAKRMRSMDSAFKVSRRIGRSSPVAFLTMAHVITHDQ